jgi:dTDP-4-amino-4,6-dideoxygalactose transaminase
MSADIPFNRPYMTGRELWLIAQAHARGHLSGDGEFTRRCHAWLEAHTGCRKALLTHSCTAALEMSALLLDLAPGDEVIMPSYTFVSTANAFVLRGAVPVFVDIRGDTMNLDERLVEAAITPRTKAICVVHYAGVACAMDVILDIARRHGLAVVEDAAQGVGSTWRGRPLGSLLVNDEAHVERAEVIREKGTNRSRFFRGQVDKYTWVDVGSSFLPGEIIAAFLCAQMEEADSITARRLALWNRYHAALADAETRGRIGRPVIPADCTHNAHMYYLLFPSLAERTAAIAALQAKGIRPVFHYVPLHSSPAGQRFGRVHGAMVNTDRAGDCLLRLPLWLPDLDIERVIGALNTHLR